MHISYKPLWHTLIKRNMRKEDLRQLEWVGRMNNIRNRAEEIINSELIYIY